MPPDAEKRPSLFISYSHRDEEWKDRLVSHLRVLHYEGLLDLWDDRRINAGDDWNEKIHAALNEASVAVLLISANFLTSKFILDEEIPRLLERRAEENLYIFPVVTRPCAWHRVKWLSQMQLRPVDARPLSAGSENQIDTDLAALADEIYQVTQQKDATSPAVQSPLTAPAKISTSRLPVTSQKLFGRDNELDLLDQYWQDPKVNIVSVIAWGGVGKSALVNHWLRRMGSHEYRNADRVYAWSFYRQGTSEQAISADEFIASALTWFDDPDPSKGTPWDKGERLASLIRKHRTLLLLDGLEPLQFPPGQEEGKLKDHALKALLRELAMDNPGLCLITTRISIADLTDFEDSTVRPINLEHLSSQAGAELLMACGVNGVQTELELVAEEYGGHSLALTLLGNYLKDVWDGNIHHLDEISELEADARYGAHAERVMAAYEKWFGDGPEIAILRLLGFFDRPANEQAVAALRYPAIPGLTDKLESLNRNEWRQVLSKLRRTKLLSDVPRDVDELDTHPLVREHFGRQVRMKTPDAWREGNDRLYEYFKLSTKELPDTIQEMEPLFRAVTYGCRAGRHRDALHEIYLTRIMRGEQSFAARKLGAHGALLSVLVSFVEDGDWSKPVAPKPPQSQGLDPNDQLTVLSQAGLYLTATKGFASDAVMACYGQVQELCKTLGKTSLLYSVLISQWRYSLVANNLTTTLELAKKLYALAKGQDDSALLLGAYRALTTTVFFRGNFRVAREYAKNAIDLWDPKSASTVEEYYAPIVTCLAIDGLAQWQLGNADSARKQVEEAVAVARQLGDLTALAVGLFLNSYLNQFCRRTQDVLANTNELIELCSRQGFALWLANGRVLKGWALADSGAVDNGLALMNQGMRNWTDAGAGLSVAYFLALQAEIMGNLGRTTEAISLLDKAQTFADRFNEHWWMAEIYRQKSEMLLRDKATEAKGESDLRLALGVARSQEAKSLELRSSLSLFRVLQAQGKTDESRVLLENIFGSFTEGFDNSDLLEAASQLEKKNN